MGTQLPSPEGAQPPIFGPCLLWPNGWMDQKMSLGTEVGLGTDDSVLDGDLAPPKRAIRLFIIAGRGPAYSAPPSLK